MPTPAPIEDRREKVKTLIAQGVPTRKISRETGLARSTIQRLSRNEGVPIKKYCGRKRAAIDPATLIAYLEAGHTCREALGVFHTSMDTLRPILRTAGRVDLMNRRKGFRDRVLTGEEKAATSGPEYLSKKDRRPIRGERMPFRENDLTCGHYFWCRDKFFQHDLGDYEWSCTGCPCKVRPEATADPVQVRGDYKPMAPLGTPSKQTERYFPPSERRLSL